MADLLLIHSLGLCLRQKAGNSKQQIKARACQLDSSVMFCTRQPSVNKYHCSTSSECLADHGATRDQKVCHEPIDRRCIPEN